MSRPARVVINLAALRHNLERARQLSPQSRIMAIVKADAYGHGLARVATALESADAFGVACLEEARLLRESGITRPVLLLEGPYNAAEIPEIRQLKLDIVVHEPGQVEMLEQAGPGDPLTVWMKIDSGMHRLGFLPGAVESMWQRLSDCRTVADNMVVMTHLALATDRESPMTREQITLFYDYCPPGAGARSIANSAGLLAFPESHTSWVRPGIMLYGVSPMEDSIGPDEGLRPVMTLESRLIAVKSVRAGGRVGYGATWQCPEDMPVGIVATGYADGYPRHAPSGTPVLVNGRRASLIGRASMDMLNVDLRGQPDARPGDPVVLWGEGLPVEEIAANAGTIPYELLCGVHKRLHFIENG